MEQSADIVIVSVFGRGNWLAGELARQGWKVSLIDVSERVGDWDAEEAEGPFGFLEGVDLVPSQKARLTAEGEAVPVPQGFVVWLPEGPIEFSSPMTKFQLEKRRVPEEVARYLQLQGAVKAEEKKELERLGRRIRKLGFEESWLANFAHQLAASTYRENHEALASEWALPVFQPYLIRHATAAGREKSLNLCRAAGAKVRTQAKVRDVRMTGRLCDAIEVEDVKSGVERGRAFVWALSSEETARFSPAVASQIFGEGTLRPSWYWARFVFSYSGASELPVWSAVVRDSLLPWTHANLLILRKEAKEGELGVWMRLPVRARFDKTYLEKVGAEAAELLTRRLPGFNPQLKLLPAEVREGDPAKAEAKYGPPRFPVFDESEIKKASERAAKNVLFDGPEQWVTLDWWGVLRQQAILKQQLEKLKEAWDAAARKAGPPKDNETRSPNP
jgi:hypothetical protein